MNRSAWSPHLRAIGIAVMIAALAIGVTKYVLTPVVFLVFEVISVTLPAWASLTLSVLLQQGLVFGSIAAGYLWVRDLDLGWIGLSRPSLKEALWIGLGWIMAFGSVVGLLIVVLLLGLNPGQNQIQGLVAENPDLIPLLIVLTIVLIGPGEELLFRGIIQGSLRERFGPMTAIILASVIFASAHVGSLTGSLGDRAITVGVLLVPSLIFGIAYERTNNLVVPSLIHGLYNATLFSITYVGLKYGPTTPAVLF
ncbi:CPBP family intramembrane glutamic endopeptidase [Halocatena salina]|uniref:CPBP family intramembrane metalloprotease n=1 Tax=Halocatena salina TaxID=2934340 RepID=A0A8U0A3K2_9EURY|nr:type II CAAX endopeptidase family protein [Halocatena salina]UPM43018.1 CPBP family intramembrane metalloprotease [Halocatena salina]